MNVLFVSSGNSNQGNPTNLVLAQGQSLIKEGIKVTFFPIIGRGVIQYLRSIKKIRQQLSEKHFDIIHAHYGFCGIVCFFAKMEQKVVISIMGNDLLGDVTESLAGKLKNFGLTWLTKFFSRYLLDYTIVKSESLASRLWRNTNYKVVPNGVNFSVFFPVEKMEARKSLKIPTDKKIILFPADTKRPEKNFQLAEASVKALKLNDIALVTIHGINQEKLNLYYNAADVVLMTSLWEGSPNVIKECLACNKVIVSTDVGDVRKNFDGVRGCFITSFNVNDVAENIMKALSVQESNGRSKLSHLASDIIAHEIIDIYKTLAN